MGLWEQGVKCVEGFEESGMTGGFPGFEGPSQPQSTLLPNPPGIHVHHRDLETAAKLVFR